MEVCTIIAKNYVAHARVLARSLGQTNPDSRLWTLIIDEFTDFIEPDHEPFEILTPADIGCAPFEQMAVRYSVLELSTAVKPWLLRHLMEATGKPVTYLDPDIRVYGSLEQLDRLAAEHGVVLIPHNNEPIPPDGRTPSQVDIMIAGTYNLGYVSLSARPEVGKLLDWWADRLRRDCRVDPLWGYFVDQRWFDLAPGFLSDLAIVRDPEFNVAYWNLHARRLERDDDRYLVDGRPLGFFHFSGFDPANPLVLSRHQSRVDVAADPVLERLLGEYAGEVMDARHAASRQWPYTYARLAGGLPAGATLAALYDSFTDECQNGSPVSLFTAEGAAMFTDWLTEQAPGAPPGVNRILAHLYESRADIRESFPDLAAVGGDELLAWGEDHGKHEVPLLAHVMGEDPSQVRTGAAADPPPAPSGPRESVSPLQQGPRGVNVVGYFRSELGTGEAARLLVRALDAAAVPLLPIHGQTIPLSRQGHAYETASPEEAAFPVNLICMNADMLPEFAGQVGDEFFAERYSIGLWFWEVSSFPARWSGSFSLLEEVWAPSAHVASALEPLAGVPVTPIRIPVAPAPPAQRSRAELGVPEGKFAFLFSFDYLSVFKRKNPLAVIEAFTRSFGAGEGAALVLKCINAERDSDSHAQLLAAAERHPDISIIDRYVPPADNLALTASCDCYVSLHRAEGLGLVMAEAMWLGKPVIATGYSGNLDFMTAENSLLVEHTLVPIGPGADPYPADGEWAEPDVDHAAVLMRRLFDGPVPARQLGARAARDIRRTHSPAAAGELMARRLESVRATGRARPRGRHAAARPAAAATLSSRVRRGPARTGQSKGRARRFVRRTLLKAMRPFAVYQQGVNAGVIDALDELRGSVADVRRGAAVERARLLAELRKYEELPSTVAEQGRAVEELQRRVEGAEGELGS